MFASNISNSKAGKFSQKIENIVEIYVENQYHFEWSHILTAD